MSNGANKKTVIISPIFTEKSLNRYKDLKICTFNVNYKSSKSEIVNEFINLYGVKPVSIRVVVQKNIKSKPGSFGRIKNRGYNKKAYIHLSDKNLEIFDEVINS